MSQTKIMWILNVTPDSFYDGGKYETIEAAKEQIDTMIEDGADIIDIGGFTSKPWSVLPSVEVELERIIPILELLETYRIAVSVDTCRSEVVKEILKFKKLNISMILVDYLMKGFCPYWLGKILDIFWCISSEHSRPCKIILITRMFAEKYIIFWKRRSHFYKTMGYRYYCRSLIWVWENSSTQL